jgi:SAM-dependent methyltransferase
MAQFRNAYYSHEHSLEVLNLLYGYDSFLDSLSSIADMGCGAGLDAAWWASLMTRDDPPEPRNYTVYAVDRDLSAIDPDTLKNNPNIIPLERDFEERAISRQVDLIWAHDTFHLAQDPWRCLTSWRNTLNQNGMLILSIPQGTYVRDNFLVVEQHAHEFYNYNILNLIYMLAITGFDCRDAYFYRKRNTPWLYAAVYASPHEPLSKTASWYDLADKNLINDSLIGSVNKCGHARLEDLVVTWLDKDYYKITD